MRKTNAALIHRISLCEQVLSLLRQEILNHSKSGDRIDSEDALAVHYRVSISTVREALRGLTQEGLIERRHGSGTYVKERPAVAKHVALVAEIDLLHSITAYFHREMFCQLRHLLLEAGQAVRLYVGTTVPGSIGTSYSDLAARQVVADLDRISAIGAFIMLRDEPWVGPARARGIPIVSNIPTLGSAVNADRDDLLRQAVAALAAAGCRRVGYLGWDPALCESTPIDLPGLHGQMAQLARKHGMIARPAWMSYANHPSATGAGWEEFLDVWRGAEEKPDGMVIADDQLLPGVFEALSSVRVRVPDQLRLAAHFTVGSSLPLPYPMIKIEYSPAEHARAMADLILGALRGAPAPAEPVLLPHRLVLPAQTVAGWEASLALAEADASRPRT